MRRPSAASPPPLVLVLLVLLPALCLADLISDLDYEDDDDKEQDSKDVSPTTGHSLVLDLSSLGVLAALKLKFVVVLLIALGVYLLVTKSYKTQCLFGGCRPNYSTYGYYPYVDYTYVGYEVPTAAYRRPGPGTGPADHHLSDLTARVWNSIDIAGMAFSALNIQEDDCRRKLVCQADRAAARNPVLRAALSWFSPSLARYRTDRSRVEVDYGGGGGGGGGAAEWRHEDPCEELYPRCLHHDLPPALGGPDRPARPPVYLEHDGHSAHRHHHHHHHPHGHHQQHIAEAWQGPPSPTSSGLDYRHHEYIYEYPQPQDADFSPETASSAQGAQGADTSVSEDGPEAVLNGEEASLASATVLAPLRSVTSAAKGVVPEAIPSATLASSSTLPAGPAGKAAFSGKPETRKRWEHEDQGLGHGQPEHQLRAPQGPRPLPQGATGTVDPDDQVRGRGVSGTTQSPGSSSTAGTAGIVLKAATETTLGPGSNDTATPHVWRRVLFGSNDHIKMHRD